MDDPSAHKQPSPSQLQKWSEEQKESARSQIAAIESKSSSSSAKANTEEAQTKRREREERRRAQQTALQDVEDSLHTPPTPSTTAEATSTSPAASGPKDPSQSSSVPYTIVVPAPSSSLEWYDPLPYSYTTIAAAHEAGIWDCPANLQERARCGVFRGLWEQGFYMGVGIRFGGEYLVYPGAFLLFIGFQFHNSRSAKWACLLGDPLRYHSHFVATVLESPTTMLRPMEIVAHGRLGTATKKSHLLCGWDDEKKEVSYLSIEWAGFG